MAKSFLVSALAAAVITIAGGAASAAPPASCAQKFVGTWVYAGGTTVIAADGKAYPKCPLCVSSQNWTCNGNTYLFSNSGPPGQFSATLSADGTRLVGGGVTATRAGPAPTAKPRQEARPDKAKCGDGNDPKRCVSLEQRGKSGRWHNFRLVNACNKAFHVKVLACDAEWAGGCKIETYRVGACETTGSSGEGKQSWDRDAVLQ
mgnify:CR=1 FL=1